MENVEDGSIEPIIKFVSVLKKLPPFGKRVLWRGYISWKSTDKETYFDDTLTQEEEGLEYGQSAYLLKDNTDFLVSQHPNIEELASEYVTHWAELPLI